MLHRFLPSGCREHVHVNLEEEDNGKRSKKRLDLAMWQLAWDRCDFLRDVQLHRFHVSCRRYTVAAVALEQLTFADCIRHKAVVMDVATTEAKEGGNAVLGVFYDMEARCALRLGFGLGRSSAVQICRAYWADEAAKLGTKFQLKSKLQAHALLWFLLLLCLQYRDLLPGAG